MSRWTFVTAGLMVAGGVGSYFGASALQGQTPSAPVFPKEMSSYREVVKRALPAVVSLETRATPVARRVPKAEGPQRRPRIEGMPGIPDEFFKRFMEGMENGEMEMPAQRSAGSGFIIDPKGVIVTNNHVVDGADRVDITLTDGRHFVSKKIVTDRKNDLAIVYFEPKGTIPSLEFGDSDSMEIGDRVLAMGAPFGLAGSVSQGIISAKGRFGMTNNRSTYEDYLQTDAAINPGNSGGPLINLEGRVVGIDTAIKSRSGGFQGVGLAISGNLAKSVVSQLMKDGVVHRGYIGVAVRPLTPEVANLMGLKEARGLELVSVSENSPAAKAGLQEGDIITSVAGHVVKDSRELQHLVGNLSLDKSYPVKVYRDGKDLTLSVFVRNAPENYGEDRTILANSPKKEKAESEELSVKSLGIELQDLTSDNAEQFGFPEGKTGVVVAKVDPNSVAAEGGLSRGMILLKVGDKPVTSAAKAREMLQGSSLQKGVLVQVQTKQGAKVRVALQAETADK
jgi:serine protease Do